MTTGYPRRIGRARAAGALIGSVVGDALGAPFEFGAAGAFSARFPPQTSEFGAQMCGGNGWRPGEFTDDTQMALMVAESLLGNEGLDEADMFERFVTWCKADPPDVGNQTRAVLSSGVAWDRAAADYAAAGHRSAGNGSLMRATPAAIYFARSELAETMDAARRISALTHGDRAAGEGCAIFHGLMATALTGGDVLSALWSVLQRVARPWREKWETVLDPAWEPSMAEEGNGAVWPTLGSAVWALRTTTTFEDAVRSAVDLGYDTDTVGAVTGALAGAVHGITAVPLAWSSKLNGTVPGHGDRVWRLPDLHLLAGRLIDRS